MRDVLVDHFVYDTFSNNMNFPSAGLSDQLRPQLLNRPCYSLMFKFRTTRDKYLGLSNIDFFFFFFQSYSQYLWCNSSKITCVIWITRKFIFLFKIKKTYTKFFTCRGGFIWLLIFIFWLIFIAGWVPSVHWGPSTIREVVLVHVVQPTSSQEAVLQETRETNESRRGAPV